MVAHEISSRIPVGVWLKVLAEKPVTKCARILTIRVLLPLMTRSGRIQPVGIDELAARYAKIRDRESVTDRRILQLNAELKHVGMLATDRHSAPGRPARYVALAPGTGFPRTLVIRPRGIAPRRIHALFAREAPGTETLIP
jgi:hypothetical protein